MLRFVNFALCKCIFHSNLSYVCAAWVQNQNAKDCINLLQKEFMQIISFVSSELRIITFPCLISLYNFLFIYDFLSNSPSVFSDAFNLASNTYEQKSQSHIVFWQNYFAILQNIAQLLLLLQLWYQAIFSKESFLITIFVSYPIFNSWFRITFSIHTIRILVQH